jgi:hypothetical protein
MAVAPEVASISAFAGAAEVAQIITNEVIKPKNLFELRII